MSNATVIKEFLVSLKYKLDKNGMRNFANSVGDVTKRMAVLGGAVVAAAAAIQAGVARMAQSFEQLYYASRRTNSAVASMEALGHAADQTGSSASAARGSLEAVARLMRNSPGTENFIANLGVQTRKANGDLRDSSEVLLDIGKRLKDMPVYQANAVGEFLGLDEDTMLAMRSGEMEAHFEMMRRMYAEAGVDADEAAKASRGFMQEIRILGKAFELLWNKSTLGLLRMLAPAIRRFREELMVNFKGIADRLGSILEWVIGVAGWFVAVIIKVVGWLGKLDTATGGLSTAVIALALAWKALNLGFMLTPIGLLVTAVLALGSAFVALVDDYQTWAEGGESAFDWSELHAGIQLTLEVLKALAQFLADVFMVQLDALKGLLKTVSALLRGDFSDAWETWAGTAMRVIRGIKAAWDDLVSTKGIRKVLSKMGFDVEVAPEPAVGGGGPVRSKAPGAATSAAIAQGLGDGSRKRQALEYFMKQGWSKEQAAGLVANIGAESTFNDKATGDNGKAYGIAQWHPDRQRNFEKWAGKSMRDSTYEEQLAFMQHELTHGTEKAAGDALRKTKTAYEAGSVVSQKYERPMDKFGEANKRGLAAVSMNSALAPTPTSVANNQANVNMPVSISVQGGGGAEETGRATARAFKDLAKDAQIRDHVTGGVTS
jgi:hypothetical protein